MFVSHAMQLQQKVATVAVAKISLLWQMLARMWKMVRQLSQTSASSDKYQLVTKQSKVLAICGRHQHCNSKSQTFAHCSRHQLVVAGDSEWSKVPGVCGRCTLEVTEEDARQLCQTQLWQILACYGRRQLEEADVNKKSKRISFWCHWHEILLWQILACSHKSQLAVADISQWWQRIANG